MTDISRYDVPREAERNDDDRDDIETAWRIVKTVANGTLVNSTDGHLAIVRALRIGRAGHNLL